MRSAAFYSLTGIYNHALKNASKLTVFRAIFETLCSTRGTVVGASKTAAEPLNATQVARHRIAVGDEARRAEEPAVSTPKVICALEGRHNKRNILYVNDFAHCGAPPGHGRI